MTKILLVDDHSDIRLEAAEKHPISLYVVNDGTIGESRPVS